MEEHISATITSIQKQTFTSFEIIVVDDCSTDSTAAIVKAMAANDARIRYERLKSNSNRPAVPRNRGIALATGEFVAFLDHDDLWSVHKLERQVRVLDEHLDVGMVHSHLFVFTPRNSLRGILHLPNPFKQHSTPEILAMRNTVQTSSVLVRTEVIREVGGFDERMELRTVEDFHLWLRISRKFPIAYISEVHGRYRKLELGASAQENLIKRHREIDNLEGTSLVVHTASPAHRLRRKLVGWLPAVYFHLVDGNIRQRFNRPSRLF